MQAYLKPHIHMTQVGSDVVALDVHEDTYFCLAGAAAFLTLGEMGAITAKTQSALQTLADADLLSGTPDRQRKVPLAAPTRATNLPLETPPTLVDRFRFARTSLYVLRHYQSASFATLIDDSAPGAVEDSAEPVRSALSRQVALFAHWLPLIPFQKACLYRAFFLRRFLMQSGLTADWVFGVSTWPFSAHCWLQVEDMVLDDDVNRVRSYQPILVV